MTEKKWRRFFKREIEKEMVEIESILDEMNNNPETKDILAPEEMHDKLFAKIREEEARKTRLTEEEKELIRLGTVYRKSRNRKRYYVLVAAVLCMLAVGITSIGGPAKIIEKVQGLIEGKEQINVDNEDGRVDEVTTISEAEAYQKIEDEFGVNFVQLYYLPEGVQFEDLYLISSTQNANLKYKGKNGENIIYSIYSNHRTGSIGRDVEDILIDEYQIELNEVTINVKKYSVDNNQYGRYFVEFEHEGIYYFLQIIDIEDEEVKKMIDNLYFR